MKHRSTSLISLCCIIARLAIPDAADAQTPIPIHGPVRISIASDINLQRSLKQGQEYWAVGQVVRFDFNFTAKDAAYAWFAYFSNGKFNQSLVAEANSPVTVPEEVPFDSRTKMRFKHLSLGWKHYYVGGTGGESGQFGLYSLGGLGLMLGLVQNAQTVAFDTIQYHLPVLPGMQNFKRLTLDLGVGTEVGLGADLYLYGELKTILPLTDAPNRYILDNKYTPYTAMVSVGFRILFF